jgi:hypothetical protein
MKIDSSEVWEIQNDACGLVSYLTTLSLSRLHSIQWIDERLRRDWKGFEGSSSNLIEVRSRHSGGRTIHRTLSWKDIIISWDKPTASTTCGKCLNKTKSASHFLYNYEAIVHLIFRHLGRYFIEPGVYLDTLWSKVVFSFWFLGVEWD